MRNPGRSLIVTLIALAVGLLPTTAEAGQFNVAMCGERSVAIHQFKFERTSKKFRAAAACSGQSAPGLKLESQEGKSSTSHWGQWKAVAPAGLPIVGWALRAKIRDEDGVTGRICFERSSIGIRCFGDDTSGSYRLHGSVASDGEALSVRLGCSSKRGCPGGRRAHLFARAVMMTIADRSSPTISVSGPILSPGTKAGESFIRIDASDLESGVEDLSVEVNGVPVDSRYDARCAEVQPEVFTAFAPCPKQVSHPIALDTEKAPFVNGSNRVEVCAYDVATDGLAESNRRCETASVEVDNSCPSSSLTNPSLRAGIGEGFESSSVIDFGISPLLAGIVSTGNGVPAAGAVVCVQERTHGSVAGFREIAELQSGSDGRFELKLGIGPSRDLRLLQRSGSTVWVRELTVRVRARPSVRLSRSRLKGGGCITIDGSVPAPANEGIVVGLQGRARGFRGWTTFATAVSDQTGRFSRQYCFKRTTRTTVYELRASVEQQGVYPYLAGFSSVRRVKVTKR